jgi:hypothetical protein
MSPIFDDSKNLIATLSLPWVFSDIPENWISEKVFSSDFKQELYEDSNSLKNYLL